jgi:hypothetical protein
MGNRLGSAIADGAQSLETPALGSKLSGRVSRDAAAAQRALNLDDVHELVRDRQEGLFLTETSEQTGGRGDSAAPRPAWLHAKNVALV